MSTESLNKNGAINKRNAETDAENLSVDFQRIKAARNMSDSEIIEHSNKNESHERVIDEALETLENLRRDLNLDNNYLESSEASDCESENGVGIDECNQQMMNNAHYLGYTACIHETFRFLDDCGIPETDPIYEHLKKQLVGSMDRT